MNKLPSFPSLSSAMTMNHSLAFIKMCFLCQRSRNNLPLSLSLFLSHTHSHSLVIFHSSTVNGDTSRVTSVSLALSFVGGKRKYTFFVRDKKKKKVHSLHSFSHTFRLTKSQSPPLSLSVCLVALWSFKCRVRMTQWHLLYSHPVEWEVVLHKTREQNCPRRSAGPCKQSDSVTFSRSLSLSVCASWWPLV